MSPIIAPLSHSMPIPFEYTVGIGPVAVLIALLLVAATGILACAITRPSRRAPHAPTLGARLATPRPTLPAEPPLAA